MSRATE
ncbi:hypothetical protein WG66_003908 [Moniliophthora roreri]|nr:hypothetical protein WG66_003908 [Moniliophthora roreri]